MNQSQAAPAPLAVRALRRVERAMGPWGVFLRGFIKRPVMVGSIIPSSGRTIARMLAPVRWDECRLFVEYGPGVGTFCQPVLNRMRGDATLLVIDTNPDFIAYLRRTIRDSRFVVVHGSAENVAAIIREHGHEQADYVLSGLPFSTLPGDIGPAIARETWGVLRPGGAFLVYQFTARARDFMARHFRHIDAGLEWWNVPPCKLFWGWKE